MGGEELTKTILAPIQVRSNEGNGKSKRPTPYNATAKKWRIKFSGLGFRPESRAMGPLEKKCPRLK